jgi:hypothetical protein
LVLMREFESVIGRCAAELLIGAVRLSPVGCFVYYAR